MYKEDFTLNNIQRLICHKTKPTQTLNYNDYPGFCLVRNSSIVYSFLEMSKRTPKVICNYNNHQDEDTSQNTLVNNNKKKIFLKRKKSLIFYCND